MALNDIEIETFKCNKCGCIKFIEQPIVVFMKDNRTNKIEKIERIHKLICCNCNQETDMLKDDFFNI